MGKQRNLKYIGTVGNIIYYKLRNGYYIRTKPDHMPQTEATKASASIFGQAAKLCKSIRRALKDFLPKTGEKYMRNRMVTALSKSLKAEIGENTNSYQSLRYLKGFHFNKESEFDARFKPELQIRWKLEDKLVIRIPAMNPAEKITVPAGADAVQLTLAATCCCMDSFEILDHAAAELTIPHNELPRDPQLIELPMKAFPHSLVLISGKLVCLEPEKNGEAEKINKLEWMPADIIEAVYVREV